MKELLHELQLVSEASPRGSHEKVATIVQISESYSLQIRKGKRMEEDSVNNRKMIQKMIIEYRKLINKQIEKLQKV